MSDKYTCIEYDEPLEASDDDGDDDEEDDAPTTRRMGRLSQHPTTLGQDVTRYFVVTLLQPPFTWGSILCLPTKLGIELLISRDFAARLLSDPMCWSTQHPCYRPTEAEVRGASVGGTIAITLTLLGCINLVKTRLLKGEAIGQTLGFISSLLVQVGLLRWMQGLAVADVVATPAESTEA